MPNFKLNNILLRENREKKRLMPISLAKSIGISLLDYRNLECGTFIPELPQLEQLCDLLDLKLEDVLYEVNEEPTTKVISIFNSKGGVGKTSSTIALASAFAEMGKRVLAVDLDYQCNLTGGFGLKPDDEKNSFNIFFNKSEYFKNPLACITKTKIDNIDVITGHSSLQQLDLVLALENNREHILYESFISIIEDNVYDYIIFDNAPHANTAVTNSMYVADYAIAPIHLEVFCLDGLDRLYDTINNCLANNNRLKDLKMFINKLDKRVGFADEFDKLLQEHYSENLLKTKVRIDIQMLKSQNERLTIFEYNEKAKCVEDFRKLAQEIDELE